MSWWWPFKKKTEESVERSPIIVAEMEALKRDTAQIKNVNRHVLARALAKGWISEEEAEAIRTIQMDTGFDERKRKEMLGGTDPSAT